MSEIIVAGIGGAVLGAVLVATISGCVMLWIARKNRKQAYYHGLINHVGTHNWNLLSNNLDPGLGISDADLKIRVVCYQMLNLLFYAWLNRDIVGRGDTLEGWQNWADAIVKGAMMSGNEQYRQCYLDILTHKDLYPPKFITWLANSLHLSATALKVDDSPQHTAESN